MQNDLLSFYAARQSRFSSQLLRITQRINRIAHARLMIALLFLAVLYFGFTNYSLLYLLPILAVIFVVLVRTHASLIQQQLHLKHLVTLNHCEARATQGDWSCYESGVAFIDPHHPYSHDLDIFGDGSLFQFLNRCNTINGRGKLALRLTHPLKTIEEIIYNQQAVRELAQKAEFRQNFQAAGLAIEEDAGDYEQLKAWAKTPSFIYGILFYRLILIFMPPITVGLVIAGFFLDAFGKYAFLMAALQWIFLGFHIKKINRFHDYVSRKKNILQKHADLLHFIRVEKFSSALLQKIWENAQHAGRKVNHLAALVRALDARLNFLTNIVANSLLLYDLQCVYRLEKWKEENAHNLDVWLHAIFDTEVLCSLATYAFNKPSFTYPSIHEQLSIQAKDLGHPLIPEAECVVNDFAVGDGPTVLIITGANMAGKSTFLRTIGINIILALNGAPVYAQTFTCPVINLRTGMRTADSLKDHQSYFYAELNRLKTIMDDLRNDIPLLILLDEILKGTNSADKQAGSIALVKQLLPHPCLALIATHDLVLGDLEKEFSGKIKNYSFEANIENDQLSFDYKLKSGIAQKMNATFLMKKIGIIPS